MFFCPTSQVESNIYDCDTKGLVLYEQSKNMEPSVYCHKVDIVKRCACNRILGQHFFSVRRNFSDNHRLLAIEWSISNLVFGYFPHAKSKSPSNNRRPSPDTLASQPGQLFGIWSCRSTKEIYGPWKGTILSSGCFEFLIDIPSADIIRTSFRLTE